MPSTSETGHAKNVANLAKLIQHCTTFGATYNPSKVDLALAALDTLSTSGRTVLDLVIQKNTDFHTAENNRKIAFKDLKSLSTRIINALKATDETIEDAKSINRKIQGARLNKSTTTADPDNPNIEANGLLSLSKCRSTSPILLEYKQISKIQFTTHKK